MLNFRSIFYWKSTYENNFRIVIFVVSLRWLKDIYRILEIFGEVEEILGSVERKTLIVLTDGLFCS